MLKNDLVGKKFEDWTVLERDTSFSKIVKYWCKCSCGVVKSVWSKSLLTNKSRSCRPCSNIKQRKTGEWVGIILLWNQFRTSATHNNIEFKITKDDILEVLEKQERKCALTGLKLKIHDNYKEKQNVKKITASIDRIDSSKGYIKENIQIVYKYVNFMKWRFSQKEFIYLCHLVSKLHPNISDNIDEESIHQNVYKPFKKG